MTQMLVIDEKFVEKVVLRIHEELDKAKLPVFVEIGILESVKLGRVAEMEDGE